MEYFIEVIIPLSLDKTYKYSITHDQNKNISTGEVEIKIDSYSLISSSEILPLPVNSDIEYEFSLGSASLAVGSRHLIDSTSFDTLKQASLDGKRLWMQAICAARAAFTDLLVNPDPAPVFTAQAIRFRAWFGLPSLPP